jgi:hypothetical protein
MKSALFPIFKLRRTLLERWVFPSIANAGSPLSVIFQKALLKSIYHHYRVVPLLSYDDASTPVSELFPASTCATNAPAAPGQSPLQQNVAMPAIRLRHFENAVCHYQCAAIRSGPTVAVPAYYTGHPTADVSDGRVLIGQRSGMGLLRPTPPRKIDAGIAVFGAGCANWYRRDSR